MADWPPVAPVQGSQQEREKDYLMLVDMFVDIVEPDVIQMILQNRNWDVDGALEDIMVLTNSAQTNAAQHVKRQQVSSERDDQEMPEINPTPTMSLDENVLFNRTTPQFKVQKTFETFPTDSQMKPKRQMYNKHFQPAVQEDKKANHASLPPMLEQYNYVKAIQITFDRAVMLIKVGVKVMIILRGPPGSGKSHLARKLLQESGVEPSAHKRHIFSTDNFFVQNNIYVFVPELLSQAHAWNQRNVAAAIREDVSPLIVDNTNIQAWEMRPYAEMAVAAGYDLEILEPDTWWFKRDSELAKRNIHGVPRAKIRLMIERYEKNITPHMLMIQFGLRYALSKVPPQPVRNYKWRDKLSSQRNNKPKKKKSDFNPKPQSNFDNINSLFCKPLQHLQINSPSFEKVTRDLTVPSSSAANFCLPHGPDFYSDVSNSENSNISSSHKNGEHDTGMNFDESDTKMLGLFENIVNNSSSFLKPFMESSKSTQKSAKTPNDNPNVDNISRNVHHKSKDSFDFMAETIKLLEALNRPSVSKNQPLAFSPKSSQLEPVAYEHSQARKVVFEPSQCETVIGEPSKQRPVSCELYEHEQVSCDISQHRPVSFETSIHGPVICEPSSDEPMRCETFQHAPVICEPPQKRVPRNILVCKETEIFLPDELFFPSCMAGSDNTYCLQKNNNSVSSQDKCEVARDLVNSIIEKATSEDSAVQLDDSTSTEREKISKLGASWDYVVVTNDNTFIYQKNDIIPLTSSALQIGNKNVIKDVTDSIYFDDEASQHKGNNEHVMFYGPNDDISNRLISYEKEVCKPSNEFVDICSWSEQLKDLKYIDSETKLHKEETHNQSCNSKDLAKEMTVSNINENNSVVSDSANTETESAKPIGLEIMKETPSLVAPSYTNLDYYSNKEDRNVKSDIMYNSKYGMNQDATGIRNCTATSTNDSSFNWNEDSHLNDLIKTNVNELTQPKPARNLIRPKLQTISATQHLNKQDYSKYFGNWDTVSNPADTWVMELGGSIKSDEPKITASVLPQRSRNIKNVNDSSTNTNYLDFLLLNDDNNSGVKVLKGNINNILNENSSEVKQNMVETLCLDKSTMTLDDSSNNVSSYDITTVTTLFPNVPEKYILEMVERCQGDIDWAVDLLLDSEYISTLSSVESENSITNDEEPKVNLTIPQELSVQSIHTSTSPKQDKKSPTQEQTELKKLLEDSVVFDKSHYSNNILKILKKKHPDYVRLIESSQCESETNVVGKLEIEEDEQDKSQTEDEVEEESNSCGGDAESEDDIVELVTNSDLIFQLEQKFGTTALPKFANITPVVKLPVSFARQLFGYIMDSLQADMDEEQALIEETIARDEEVARLLQYQDQDAKPQLQEVMDMEIALAMHRADQEEWKDNDHETLAAKLSKNILLDKFPQVDPKMLMEVLHAHGYSLHDTIDSLTLGLGVTPGPSTSCEHTLSNDSPKDMKFTSVVVSDDLSGSTSRTVAKPVNEAEIHRAQAASYYSLRMECLGKANEAFRSGNKTVATYYSQLAQMHKDKMEHSNSKAAACLFSTHKKGTKTLDLHFLHIKEAEVVLDMFLDEVVTNIGECKKRQQVVFLVTGRGLRSVRGVSVIKPMVQRKLQARGIPYNEINPGMLSAVVRATTPLSYTL